MAGRLKKVKVDAGQAKVNRLDRIIAGLERRAKEKGADHAMIRKELAEKGAERRRLAT